MPICPKCGTIAASKFCPNCGTPLSESNTNPSQSGFTSPYSQVDPRQSQGPGSQVYQTQNAPRSEVSSRQGYSGQVQSGASQNNDVTYHSGRYAQTGEVSRNQSGGYPPQREVSSQQGYGQYTPSSAQPPQREVSSRQGYSQAPGHFAPSQQPAAASMGSDPKNYKLKWHKFLVYFWLWFDGLFAIGDGCYCIYLSTQWSPYASDPDVSKLIAYLIIAGGIEIILGIFSFVVLFPLARFKKGAPKLLITFMACAAVFKLLVCFFSLFMGSVTGMEFGRAAWSFLVMSGTHRYYSSREDLFVR